MAPRFSILTPVYEPPPGALRKMLRSVARQRCGDWEHCLVDDGSKAPHVREILAAAAAADPRVRVIFRGENAGIVAASNDALEMAAGEFVVLLDHDDLLHPDALIEVEEALDRAPDVDYVYTDEDKVDERGFHSGAFFKPDWSPERMRTQMYSCHMSTLRRSLVEEVGGFDARFEGSQDWDLVLKVTERARRVLHVPKVLYHWRTLAASTASGGEDVKPWAFEAGPRAVQAHCERIGLPAKVTMDAADPGVLHLDPELEEQPLVSIILPTAGQKREIRFEFMVMVENCVRSVVENSTYENYEIVVVADRTMPTEVKERLIELGGAQLRIVPATADEFDFSEMINTGAQAARGEYLLLLNDDIDISTPNWIERMVMYAAQEDVGAVGGRLIWGDGRLQHVGVDCDHGLPGHTYRGFPGDYKGYANTVLIARNCMAVTGACLMTRRDLYFELGGLSSELPVSFNDVDYCLKCFVSGRRVVYDPDLLLIHYESSSRDPTVHDWEFHKLVGRWGSVMAADPYINPNMRRGVPRMTGMFVWAKRRRPKLLRR